MKIYRNLFEQIISPENLFAAWDAFKAQKRNKPDVAAFEWRLEQHIFQMHRELRRKTYRHSPYTGFYIRDPKQRHIHKAAVRDRVVHHAVFLGINRIFEETFIPTSFSCRVGLGTHRGVAVLEAMARNISRNNTRPCFVLKCDVEKFFDTVDHGILLSMLKKRIKDADVTWLLGTIIESFTSSYSTLFEPKGLPIGNLTSQLFANVYMNELDQFVKHTLKVVYYGRYTDDFVIVADNPAYLQALLPPIRAFLNDKLALRLHPKKVALRRFHRGFGFLGYVVFPNHRLLRTKTKRRMFKKITRRIMAYRVGLIPKVTLERSLQSYLGVLSHANTYKLREELLNHFWFEVTQTT